MNDFVTIEIGEFCNKIITTQEGTFIEIDKSLLQEVIELLEKGVCCE